MDTNENIENSKKVPTRNSLPFLDRMQVLKKIIREYDYSPDRIQKTIENLQEILVERKNEIQKEELENSKQQQQILEILEKIKASGLPIEEMSKFCNGDINTVLSNYKYEFVDVNGIKRFWSGKGKMPLALIELMKRDGTSKDDYLRKKSDL